MVLSATARSSSGGQTRLSLREIVEDEPPPATRRRSTAAAPPARRARRRRSLVHHRERELLGIVATLPTSASGVGVPASTSSAARLLEGLARSAAAAAARGRPCGSDTAPASWAAGLHAWRSAALPAPETAWAPRASMVARQRHLVGAHFLEQTRRAASLQRSPETRARRARRWRALHGTIVASPPLRRADRAAAHAVQDLPLP